MVCLGGRRDDGAPFIIVDMICGAWGGRPDKDGIEAITNPSQNLSNTPVETMEAQHPVRIEEYALVPDSGGAGKWRGGLGIARSYRLLGDEAQLQLRADRAKFQPYGLSGGEPGRSTRNFLERNGEMEEVPGKITMTLRRGEMIRHEQAGGGGFGDPLTRDPARVARDVWNRKITASFAREKHGVVVDPESGELDVTATAQLRSELEKAAEALLEARG